MFLRLTNVLQVEVETQEWDILEKEAVHIKEKEVYKA